MKRIHKHTPTINYARLKFTLILLALLSLGYYVKADVPCYQAIQSQHDSIDSLETRLATAQSVPYNQGYQAGYKVAKNEQWQPNDNQTTLIIVLGGISFCIIAYGMFVKN